MTEQKITTKSQVDTWEQVMAMKSKDNRHKGVANTLMPDEIETIMATADFFGASESDLYQIRFDLFVARYRIFDWLAMAVQGRLGCRLATQVFTYSFLKSEGNVTAFIDDLRVTDYDIDDSYKVIDLGGRN